MGRTRQLPVTAILVAACLLVLGAGLVWLRELRAEATRSLAVLDSRRQEAARLSRSDPAPVPENEAAVAAELDRAVRLHREICTELSGRTPALLAVPAPAGPVEAYFDLQGYASRMRKLASEGRVVLKDGESFGFASYSGAGPETGLIPAVQRQRIVMERLVGNLLSAHPDALVGVWRERPPPIEGRPEGAETDYFSPDRRVAIRIDKLCGGGLFCLEFTGRTPVLRAFLNSVDDYELPLIVRSVEVGPASGQGQQGAGASSLSKFRVVVQLLELAGTIPAASP